MLTTFKIFEMLYNFGLDSKKIRFEENKQTKKKSLGDVH